MHASKCSPEELAARLGIEVDSSGAVAWGGLADLVRQAVGRWSLVRPATLRRFVRRTLEAVGADSAGSLIRVSEAIERIAQLGDIEPVFVGDLERPADSGPDGEDALAAPPGARLAAAAPRHVRIGERRLIIGLGDSLPFATEPFGILGGAVSLARWAQADEVTASLLEAAGFAECDLEDWLGAPGWLVHLERRRASLGAPLSELWTSLEGALGEIGMPVSDASRCAVVAGRPGGYFGRAEALDGRWQRGDSVVDGLWCGVLKGQREAHLRPVIAEAHGGRVVRALELYDFDEFRWALLARGCHTDQEVVRAREGRLEFTFPCPFRWRRLAALCCVDGWEWTLPPWLVAADLAPALTGALLQ